MPEPDAAAIGGPSPDGPPLESVLSGWEHPPARRARRFDTVLLELVLVACGLGLFWLGAWLVMLWRGRTPARILQGLELRDARTGARPAIWRCAGRELTAKALFVLGPAAALLQGGRPSRGLWDRLWGTVLVDTRLAGEPPVALSPEGADSSPR